MPKFGPLSRRDLIHYLKMLGFQGPFAGSRHSFEHYLNAVPDVPPPDDDRLEN